MQFQKIALLKLLALAFFTLFFSFSTQLFASPSVPQKQADTPKDMPIRVNISGGSTVCYIPQFSLGSKNSSYLGLLNCSLPEAKPARYDVFGRLSFNINNTSLCITAPESVAESKRESDYLYLSPCVLNDKKQRWKIKNGSFWSLDDFYSIKDDGDYLYAVWFKDNEFKTHTLDKSMRQYLCNNGKILYFKFIKQYIYKRLYKNY